MRSYEETQLPMHTGNLGRRQLVSKTEVHIYLGRYVREGKITEIGRHLLLRYNKIAKPMDGPPARNWAVNNNYYEAHK